MFQLGKLGTQSPAFTKPEGKKIRQGNDGMKGGERHRKLRKRQTPDSS